MYLGSPHMGVLQQMTTLHFVQRHATRPPSTRRLVSPLWLTLHDKFLWYAFSTVLWAKPHQSAFSQICSQARKLACSTLMWLCSQTMCLLAHHKNLLGAAPPNPCCCTWTKFLSHLISNSLISYLTQFLPIPLSNLVILKFIQYLLLLYLLILISILFQF